MTHAINPYVYARLLAQNGTPLTTEQDADGDWHLGVSSIQDVIEDANNTVLAGTDTLKAANSYTYTGTGTTTLGVNSIQVSFYCDKTCLVYVEQSIDNTNWDISDKYAYTALSNFGVTVQAVAAYIRLRITSTAQTGTFRLMTFLCPIADPLPRTLDANQNLRIASPKDSFNFEAKMTPMNEVRVAEKVRLVGSQFDGNTLDSNYWLTSVSTGTVTQSGTEAIITSGTANGHYARMYSVRRARYVAGVANKARMHIRLADTGTANVKRRWGVAWGASMPTITDGAYFQLDGTTFSVVTLKGGSETTVSSGSFNGQIGYAYAPTTNNAVYEILYTNGSVYFSIDGTLLHKVTASTATWTNTMSMHIWMEASNSGNSSAVAMYTRVASIARLGKLETQPKYYNLTGNAATHTLKLGAGILHNIIFNNTSGTSLIIYDNTTGAAPIIGSISTASAALGSWDYHLPFFNGLVIVTTGNNLDLTVIYE